MRSDTTLLQAAVQHGLVRSRVSLLWFIRVDF
ncbi:uncharacterized protein METZ01_LOCUS457532, partial [marine metagenome]